MENLFFHSQMRYHHYKPFRENGEYPSRLAKWLQNVDDEAHQKLLLRLATHVFFIDARQMAALYREAFRGIMLPVIERDMPLGRLLDPHYPSLRMEELKRFTLYAVTESLSIPDFLRENSLIGIPRPKHLGTDPEFVKARLPKSWEGLRGVFVLEDFVSTGYQVRDILLAVRAAVPPDLEVIFVPLMASDRADDVFDLLRGVGISVLPVLRLSRANRLTRHSTPDEHSDFAEFRPLVLHTASRVLESHGIADDPPGDPFGYDDSGLLVVTAHNAPDNTLPLIHHLAPGWQPLFRRLHHAKGT